MACKTAFLLALLVAASQAAPQGLVDTGAQQTNSSTVSTGADTSTSSSVSGGSGSGSGSGVDASSSTPSPTTGSSAGSRPPTIVFPSISNFLPTFNFSGNPGSASASGQSPLAAIISVIPNAINAERERFGNAVQQLVSEQVNAATDSIGTAAQTGGQLFSNGIRVIASWPTFWGNLLG